VREVAEASEGRVRLKVGTLYGVLERLAKRDINCNVSYRWPIHTMRGSADLGYREGQFPVAERKAQRIFSLPMYPHLKDEEVDTVIEVLRDVV